MNKTQRGISRLQKNARADLFLFFFPVCCCCRRRRIRCSRVVKGRFLLDLLHVNLAGPTFETMPKRRETQVRLRFDSFSPTLVKPSFRCSHMLKPSVSHRERESRLATKFLRRIIVLNGQLFSLSPLSLAEFLTGRLLFSPFFFLLLPGVPLYTIFI